ncbi:hypothetical protein [Gordonia sihwensis]|uniref:hypothetical protein n=1 Tax=Gordonia sihwensis TaxID=173559 RepID=UPI0005EFE332|nr:hypothetical protein [Gordonia sihwensis]KJR10247.1 hypothetical protein UG54_01320 [Gordonia sihwensis]
MAENEQTAVDVIDATLTATQWSSRDFNRRTAHTIAADLAGAGFPLDKPTSRAGKDQRIPRTRDETRLHIAQTLRTQFEQQPMTMVADDSKLLALSEMVLRIAEGRA